MTNNIKTWKLKCLLSILFALGLTGCSDQIQVNNETTSTKPVKYISYLTGSQQASGVLVKYRSSTNSNSRARSLDSAGLVEQQQTELLDNLVLADPIDGLTVNDTLTSLSTDPNILYAEPNYIMTPQAIIPNDPEFSKQLPLNNVDNIDIDAPEAWDVTTGSKNVLIAVIDTGIDYTHPDLINQIWRNTNEIPDNQIDDDNNGYIDDVLGWDFYSNDNDPMDDHDHGTTVAGIIGAEGNNNLGITGVNWQVKLMPLKFLNAQGHGAISDVIKAIKYAVNNGAKISNNSWGGTFFSQSLFDTIQMAQQQDHLFITASGNYASDNDKTPYYPSSYNLPNIISVAALDYKDKLASFSNFGVNSVDIAAPGIAVYSTARNNGYLNYSGSSNAAALVTGAIGLMLSKSELLSAQELKTALLASVIPLPNLTNFIASGGKLNLFTAIDSVKTPVQ